MWRVLFVPEAASEFDELPARERSALQEAIRKLEALGDQLGAPHTSSVRGVAYSLRELRPRRGSSPWRALYRRIGDVMVIGAIGPEAQKNRNAFNRAVALAVSRLGEFEVQGED